MPRGKQLVSLRDTCLTSIVTNMDDLWCKHYLETYAKENRFFRYVVGPFDGLPSKLLCRLVALMKEEKRLRRHHLELLINLQLQQLDLSGESEEVYHPLRLAAIRCLNLKSLNLSGCDRISKQVYQQLMPLFNQLQVLDLSLTKSGDSCLLILGAYCKDLRELNLRGCPVTDAGVRGLCVSVDDLGNASQRLGQCKSVVKLDVAFTQVTERGVEMALDNLKFLTEFECTNSVQVLCRMHRTAWEASLPGVPQYRLTELHCAGDDDDDDADDDVDDALTYRRGDLVVAASLCAPLTRLRLVTRPGLTDADLTALASSRQVRRLRHLSVGGGRTCRVTFQGGLAPLLEACGDSLLSLTLAELDVAIDVGAVLRRCPNLTALHLLDNAGYDGGGADAGAVGRLETLHVSCSSESSGPSGADWSGLLASAELRHLKLRGCAALTEEVWRRAWNGHRFGRLQRLELDECHQMTPAGVDLVAARAGALSLLKTWRCRRLTRQDADRWTARALKKKWRLAVHWT